VAELRERLRQQALGTAGPVVEPTPSEQTHHQHIISTSSAHHQHTIGATGESVSDDDVRASRCTEWLFVALDERCVQIEAEQSRSGEVVARLRCDD
jgi:hypothetical protein